MNIGPSNTFSSKLTAMVSTSRQDAAARRDEARMKSSGAALETLKQKRSTTSDDAKAVAKEKVERLKARIRMLQMMATTDPRGTARLAAKLARELGAAVKAYAAAGGNTAGMAGVAPKPEAASADATTAPVDQAYTAIDPSSENEARSAAAETVAADEGEEADTEAGTDEKTQARHNPYQKAMDAAQADMAERSRNAAERRADGEFMTEVKKLTSELKSALRRAVEALKQNDGAEAPERDQAEKAVRELEHEIKSSERALSEANPDPGISITV
ncbi:MAG: hypothetical protein DCF29_11695 [Alphaproteobacteria bacterium]|nr:MAG: hypothetical protein DCF29_11695 [Alphaproteobacteria bacterium]